MRVALCFRVSGFRAHWFDLAVHVKRAAIRDVYGLSGVLQVLSPT